MTTPNGAIGDTTRRHTHRTRPEAERCPLCGSPTTAAIRAQIELDLRARLATAEQVLRDQLAREQREMVAKAAVEPGPEDLATKLGGKVQRSPSPSPNPAAQDWTNQPAETLGEVSEPEIQAQVSAPEAGTSQRVPAQDREICFRRNQV
jgi:hypothetical protein